MEYHNFDSQSPSDFGAEYPFMRYWKEPLFIIIVVLKFLFDESLLCGQFYHIRFSGIREASKQAIGA